MPCPGGNRRNRGVRRAGCPIDFAPARAYLGAAVVALTGTGLLSELLASLIPKEESY
jgi:hypothetical protein